MPTFTTSVAASSDDAVELSGSMTTNATTLNANQAGQIIGLRFTNVTIPVGSTITSAYITVNITSTSYDDPDVTIRSSGEPDTTTFTTTTNDITDRFKTSTSVAWSATGIGSGSNNSPDLATIIAETIAISGWASGNNLNIYITGSASSAFRCYAYDNGSNYPSITINYTEPSAGGQPPRTMHQKRQRQ